ncbi:putative 2og-fe oxygenase superfamily protein [Daldinia childiae]|uniref:putative 2og-fe oxygenase superfamily protein n=1 Tax=Daldinia childiae TaxID=326645 RepID=UPI0014455EDE|nr:putative 2og-fe oxygenase superfamily protein [Daldinia childiae]KAF3061546.1 putative 2og-fe oxygenase superfamily protein [Daldinia childiae]
MAISTDVPQTVEWNGKKVPVYPMEIIDFSKLLSQEPAEIERLVSCCQETGYFYLDLRGIDGRRMLEDQQDTLKLMYRFFDAPLEAKNEFGLVAPHLGYEPVGSRTGVLENTKDGYEMIKVSRDEIQKDSPHLPAVIKNSPDMKVLEHAIAGANIATKTILSALSTGLGLTGASRFENTHRNDRPSTSTIAMMHYIPSDPTAKNIGHQKHTDISSLTFLFAEQWGLQVRPPGAKEFGFVEPKDGMAVINVGDSLRFASGHTMQSCIHRVVPLDPTEHRYSIAYFLRAENDVMFTDSEGRLITAGQWHDEKFFAFTSPPEIQALAPSSMILGGMTEEDEPVEATASKDAPSPVVGATTLGDSVQVY